MPIPPTPTIAEAGLTLPGTYDESDPSGGLEETLRLIEYAEERDLVGSTDEIVERLRADPAIDGRTAVRVAVPYAFHRDEYRQILSDIAEGVLPRLGWRPAGSAAAVAA